MKKIKIILLVLTAAAALTAVGLLLFLKFTSWGFAREVSAEEKTIRMQVVTSAQRWLGAQEGDADHARIIQVYNTHEPLAQDYTVTLDDNWCAAFASAVAIECGMTDIIPTECGCQRQIGLWQELGCWVENDNYIPLPGDYIYYAWDEDFSLGDCTGWADHVGIVVGTAGPFIKVIEGNQSDSVAYRIILLGDYQIRGYAVPNYESLTE